MPVRLSLPSLSNFGLIMKRPPFSLVLISVCAVSLGCGSGADSRGEEALKRIRNRPSPGYVRVVNLTGARIAVTKNARPLMASVDPDQSSKLVAFAAGKGVIQVDSRPVTIDLKSGEGTTILVYPSTKQDLIASEIRRPGAFNVKVYFVPGDGSARIPANGILLSGPTSTKIVVNTESLLLSPGKYTLNGEEIAIEPKFAYTFLFVPWKDKLRPFLMLNTPNERPSGSGASAS